MRILNLCLLLTLEYLALSEPNWKVSHPDTLYAWEGACVWIPCHYIIPRSQVLLEKLAVFHNYAYDDSIKSFKGTVLYNNTKIGESPSHQERVQFLGDTKSNCTLSIDPVQVQDSGRLGLRMTSGKDKWMEEIRLNVSKMPFPPHIQLPPEIQESQSITLTCLLKFACFGYPIQLQWSLEGHAGTSTSFSTKKVFTQSTLNFEPRWTDHGRNLTCRVRNSTKVLAEETVRLDVKHVPKLKIEVSPSEARVMEGESLNMTCQVVSSHPEYKTVSWLKDGRPLIGKKTLTLLLPAVTKNMSGTYCCQASNDLGAGLSEEVTVTVLYFPEPSKVQILRSPAKEGNSVELICTSLANPPATNYTWYHNGREMPGRTQEKFQISKVFLWHAGNYSCMAANSLGSGNIGQEAELDVQYAPKEVTTVIQNSTPIREGDSVTVFCSYNSSNPSVTRYEWSPRGSWSEPTSRVLTIRNIAWDAAPIACAACNLWCTWASPVSLDVQYAPRDVRVLQLSPPSEIHAQNQVRLRCDFSKSRPTEVHFFWRKNGSLLQEGRELSFDAISPEDSGIYSCSVNNSIGQTSSRPWRLQVLYPPRRLHVAISPGDSVMEGTRAALTCELDANPPASQYVWFDWHNQDLHYPGQTLILEPTKVQHSGAYRCRGTNRLGTGESPPSTLTVYYSPETIGKRVAVGLGFCLFIFILAIWGVKLQQKWKRTQSQQGLQENSSGQSFFVRNKKARRVPLSGGHHSLGCYNPVMDDAISYATLRFPETDTPGAGNARTSEMQGPPPNSEDAITYSVVQMRRVGDYENVAPSCPEEEEIHYSELVQFGAGQRPCAREDVEYVTLKH